MDILNIMIAQETIHKFLIVMKSFAFVITLFWFFLIILKKFTTRKKKVKSMIKCTSFVLLWLIAACLIILSMLSMHRTKDFSNPLYIAKQSLLNPSLSDIHQTACFTSGIEFWIYLFIATLSIMAVTPQFQNKMYLLF